MKANVEEIKAIIKDVETAADVDAMSEGDDFADVGIDSLEIFNILLGVEEKYGISIPNEQAENLNSIAAILGFLTELD
ncbi:acyl carrier protein [Thiosocius teredinicola]|uniref:acyl carrier protein n=1 Tax=Thiosocius teredinicola TaxID=1973002 RepID=UPI000991396F